MSMIIDGILLLALLICMIVGGRRGFIKSAVRVIGCIVALAAAFWLSTPVAEWLFDGVLQSGIEQSVTEKLTDASVSSAQTLEQQIDGILSTVPAFVRSTLELYGFGDPSEIAQMVETQGAQTVPSVAQTIVTHVIRPPCVFLLQMVCFLVLFLLLNIGCRLLGKLLDAVFNLPLLSGINRVLGVAMGLLEGAVLVLLLVTGLQIYNTLVGPEAAVPQEILRQTTVYSAVVDHNFLLYPRVIQDALAFWKQ